MARFVRESRIQDNYTQIPHGLWTAPVSYGAKILLGWLHSHHASYLARLTNNRIRTELGCSGQVGQWVDELVQAGFIRVEKNGQANRFILLAGAWEALACRESNQPENGHPDQEAPEPTDYRSVTDRLPAGNRPKNGHIEDYVEDQGEHHSFSPAAEIEHSEELTLIAEPIITAEVVDQSDLDFERWWKQYPIKKEKKQAKEQWAKLKPHERTLALEALPDHLAYWEREGTKEKFIPYGIRWLRNRRWEDELVSDYKPAMTLREQAIYAALHDRHTQENPDDTTGRDQSAGELDWDDEWVG